MAAVRSINLGSQGLEVSVQGLGCMGMSTFYGPPKPEDEMISVIREAVNLGVTFLDTADFYGAAGANEILVGKAIQGIKDKVKIASKFGVCIAEDGSLSIRGDPAHVRAACEASLKRLGVDCIDLYYLARLDPKVPIEITIGELKKLVGEGKIKYIGLSEAPASEIRRAHAVHPITAVQLEWSLWARDVEEDVIPVCRELGIGIVAYSPLGRGFFARKDLLNDLTEDDYRKTLPKLLPHHQERNKLIFEHLQAFATKKNCTPGQIALAWVHSQGTDVATIPGTTKVKNLKDNINSLLVHLSREELQEIEAIIPKDVLSEERYHGPTNMVSWKYASTPSLSSWQGE